MDLQLILQNESGKRHHNKRMARFSIHYLYERENSSGAETIRHNFSAKESAGVQCAHGRQISGTVAGRYHWHTQ